MPVSAYFSLRPRRPARDLLTRAANTGLCLIALGALACSAERPGPVGAGGEPAVAQAESIEFVVPSTLLLAPGETDALTVAVSPEGFHAVAFSLMAGTSGTFDGFLETASTVTDAHGLAENLLTAPSSPAVFMVRASIGEDLWATRTVSVSMDGFATLKVTPAYSGTRLVSGWTASARVGLACSEVDSLWEDGALLSRGTDEVELAGVPVASQVALLLRGGHFVGGCTTVQYLEAAEERSIEVQVTDRAMQLVDGEFALRLGITERAQPFITVLEEAAATAGEGYAQGTTDDADVLLTDMAQASGSAASSAEFKAMVANAGLGAVVTEHLADPFRVRSLIFDLLLTAAARLDGDDVIVATAKLDPSEPSLQLVTAAGVPAAESGFLGSAPLSIVREPEDVLVLGFDLRFQATRWLAAVAALAPEDQTSDPPATVLINGIDCDVLGIALSEAAGGEVIEACDDSCAMTLCEKALELGWERAADSGDGLTTLRVGVTGKAAIDDEARPIGLSGSWVGSFDSSEVDVAGSATSTESAER